MEEKQVSIEPKAAPVERFSGSILIEDEEPLFRNRTFCLSCGSWDVDEEHTCEGRQAA